VDVLTLFCPAKINLFLAITGRRDDGFHHLVSVAAPLDWGDTLTIRRAEDGMFSLTCDDSEVPTGENNLVLKAARAFHEATEWSGGAHFHLQKIVPMGAGLGGGSSDAASALRGLNTLAGEPLSETGLAGIAAGVGSDCPLFLSNGPVVMRGRGEEISSFGPEVAARLGSSRLLLMKPAFGVNTAWAYGALMARAPGSYLVKAEAEAKLANWMHAPGAPLENLAYNNMEPAVWAKFLALPTLAEELRREFGLKLHMSGSGSACFVVMGPEADESAIRARVRASWGDGALVRTVSVVS
jgi:4-diphosphocytidyl-2-C-methyl-D-erythritol kinase